MIFEPDQLAFIVRPPKPSRAPIGETQTVDLRFVALEASVSRIRRDQASRLVAGPSGPALDSHSHRGREVMRGIPVIADGVGGTQPGTNPLTETLARSEQSRRDRMSA